LLLWVAEATRIAPSRRGGGLAADFERCLSAARWSRVTIHQLVSDLFQVGCTDFFHFTLVAAFFRPPAAMYAARAKKRS
jgi:hypothetical protein